MEAMNIRRERIVGYINRNRNVSFQQLKEEFPEVSEMTLRTDLKFLDEERRIVRIHGGAKSVDVVVGTDDYYGKRAVRNEEEKQIIAGKAVQLIQPHMSLFLDSGTTTTVLSRMIPDQPMIIFTSGLSCMGELASLEKASIYMPAGKLNRYSLSICGPEGIAALSRINFDIAFMGVTSFDMESGFSCGVEEEAELKRAAMQRAGKRVMLMDSSKTGRHSTFSFAGPDEVDIVVSDGRMPEQVREFFVSHGVDVI